MGKGYDPQKAILKSLLEQYLDLTKLKAFVVNKLNVTEIMISVQDRVENIVEKGENAD